MSKKVALRVRSRRTLKWANGAWEQKSGIFYSFLLQNAFRQITKGAIWNNNKWQIAGGGWERMRCLLWWIDEAFSPAFFFDAFHPTRFAGIFIFLMTSINQHECLAQLLMEIKESFRRCRCCHILCPTVTLRLLNQRVQIYIFSPSANFNVFLLVPFPFRFCAPCEILLLLLKPIKQRLLKNTIFTQAERQVGGGRGEQRRKNDKSLTIK